jgi:hypothetical protein
VTTGRSRPLRSGATLTPTARPFCAPAAYAPAVSTEGLRLSVYFGERNRVHGGLLPDALMDRLAAAEVLASALLRDPADGGGLASPA